MTLSAPVGNKFMKQNSLVQISKGRQMNTIIEEIKYSKWLAMKASLIALVTFLQEPPPPGSTIVQVRRNDQCSNP